MGATLSTVNDTIFGEDSSTAGPPRRWLPKTASLYEPLAIAETALEMEVAATSEDDLKIAYVGEFGNAPDAQWVNAHRFGDTRQRGHAYVWTGRIDQISSSLPTLRWMAVEHTSGWDVYAVPIPGHGENAKDMHRYVERMRVRLQIVNADNWFVVPQQANGRGQVPLRVWRQLLGDRAPGVVEAVDGAGVGDTGKAAKTTVHEGGDTYGKNSGKGNDGNNGNDGNDDAPAYSQHDAFATIPPQARVVVEDGCNWLEVVKDGRGGEIDRCIMRWHIVRSGLPAGIDTTSKVPICFNATYTLDAPFANLAGIPRYYTNNGSARDATTDPDQVPALLQNGSAIWRL